MKRPRNVWLGVALAAVAAFPAAGCGGGSHKDASHGGAEVTPAAPPTPDTTPIEALRTPAGLVLKIDAGTTPSVPPTTTTPTPSK